MTESTPEQPESASESAEGVSDSQATDLPTLLGRDPDADEQRAWLALAPNLRERAVGRISLLQRWWGDRGDLTADQAAAIADVTTKRFYQMASAWRKQPGLLAVGAYAAAPVERAARISPLVNASLQANVAKVVAGNETRPIEWLRRQLEDVVRPLLPETDGEGKKLTIPSQNVVRAVITRELNRVAEEKLLGESITMDCCPTSMRKADGSPHVLFVIIDRGTLRILGHALGELESGLAGYSRAAASALEWIGRDRDAALPWASRTRRADMVVGLDREACEDWIRRYRDRADAFDFSATTNDKRFGSQVRKYVGDRFGRIHLRSRWVSGTPPLEEGDEVFSDAAAAERLSAEVESYNETKALDRASGAANAAPQPLLDALSFLAG